MEKIIIRKKEEYVHHFYCDECNKYLGNTEEYDDGYYPSLGEFKLAFHLPGGWYKVEKCVCDECKEKYLSRLENVLKDLEFIKK